MLLVMVIISASVGDDAQGFRWWQWLEFPVMVMVALERITKVGDGSLSLK